MMTETPVQPAAVRSPNEATTSRVAELKPTSLEYLLRFFVVGLGVLLGAFIALVVGIVTGLFAIC